MQSVVTSAAQQESEYRVVSSIRPTQRFRYAPHRNSAGTPPAIADLWKTRGSAVTERPRNAS